MRRILVLILIIFFHSQIKGQIGLSEDDYSNYINAIHSILKKYPDATLIDIYKYLFQSRFGPEHLVSDSLIAFNMLKDELNNEEIKSYKLKSDTLLVELLYPDKKYVRVDLSLVKDRVIPINLFFTAFLQSVEKHDSLQIERWKNDWNQIVQRLENENLKIKNFKEDKNKIENAFRQNRFVFSHSQIYKTHYKPHYRIINYKIFEKFLLPYLKQYRIKFVE